MKKFIFLFVAIIAVSNKSFAEEFKCGEYLTEGTEDSKVKYQECMAKLVSIGDKAVEVQKKINQQKELQK